MLFFFQAEDGIRDIGVTGVQTCALRSSAHTLLYLSQRPHIYGSCGGAQGKRATQNAAHGHSSTRTLAHHAPRSEERRGGEEWRSRWAPYHLKKKEKDN